jgi:hypothetical protein
MSTGFAASILTPSSLKTPVPAAAALIGSPAKDNGKKLYQWSLTAIAAGNTADTLSSWHHPETNPILANPGASFDAKSLALKSAFLGGSLLIEHFALRHNSRLYRPFAWLNFSVAGMLGGVAVHNARLH